MTPEEEIIYQTILPMRRRHEPEQSIEDYCRQAAQAIAAQLPIGRVRRILASAHMATPSSPPTRCEAQLSEIIGAAKRALDEADPGDALAESRDQCAKEMRPLIPTIRIGMGNQEAAKVKDDFWSLAAKWERT